MNDFKKSLLQRGMKLIADPRVLKLMQDQRVTKAVIAAMAMPGKVQHFTQEQRERLAKLLDLATQEELRDVQRTVRRLEDELARMREKERGRG